MRKIKEVLRLRFELGLGQRAHEAGLEPIRTRFQPSASQSHTKSTADRSRPCADVTSRRTKQLRPMGVERVTFVIQAENRKEVLAQVVLRFQSLDVEIDALYMVRRRGSESMGMCVTIEAGQEVSRVVKADLERIASVRSVKIDRSTKQWT